MESATARRNPVSAVPVGGLLREWRAARRLSQLDLALAAGISSRHLSYVETGKARASRETVAKLADTLEMPLRERNALLLAAGYAPEYPETGLATPEMAQMRHAIELILAQQEPYPAFLINRQWEVLSANRGAECVNRFMLGGRASAHSNMMRQFFDPDDLRAAVVNWEEVASEMIRHLHDYVAATPTDHVAKSLLEEALVRPGVPARWRLRDLSAKPSPLLTTVLRRDGVELRFFSTITTFAAPRDITLDELYIECCFPMDEETARYCRELADQARSGEE